jgi:hypothetical protein
MPSRAFRRSCVSVPDYRKLNNGKLGLQHADSTLQGKNVKPHCCGHPTDCRLEGNNVNPLWTPTWLHTTKQQCEHTTVDIYMTTQKRQLCEPTLLWTRSWLHTTRQQCKPTLLWTRSWLHTTRQQCETTLLWTPSWTHYKATVWSHTAVDTILTTHDTATIWAHNAVDNLLSTHCCGHPHSYTLQGNNMNLHCCGHPRDNTLQCNSVNPDCCGHPPDQTLQDNIVNLHCCGRPPDHPIQGNIVNTQQCGFTMLPCRLQSAPAATWSRRCLSCLISYALVLYLVSSWTTLKCDIWESAMANNQVSSSVEMLHWSGIPRRFDRP